MDLENGKVRPVALAELGQRYQRYRLADPHGEAALAGSLRRWGQLSPVIACVRGAKLELLDGFKSPHGGASGARPDDVERARAGCG